MSYRVVCFSNRKVILISASLTVSRCPNSVCYQSLVREAIRTVLLLREMNGNFLEISRAADKLQSCLAQQSEGNHQKR
eukprot:5951931-Pyramimonas_sp.AAC.1